MFLFKRLRGEVGMFWKSGWFLQGLDPSKGSKNLTLAAVKGRVGHIPMLQDEVLKVLARY